MKQTLKSILTIANEISKKHTIWDTIIFFQDCAEKMYDIEEKAKKQHARLKKQLVGGIKNGISDKMIDSILNKIIAVKVIRNNEIRDFTKILMRAVGVKLADEVLKEISFIIKNTDSIIPKKVMIESIQSEISSYLIKQK